METLLLFVGDFSGQPASSKLKRRLFPQLLRGDTPQKSRSFLIFITMAFPFPSSHSLMC